jgi:hypothetical protein
MRQVYPEAVRPDTPALALLKGGHATIGLRAFGQEPPPAAPAAEELADPHHFQDAQVLITRSGGAPGSAPFGAAFKGGHNAEHHNHNDVGSYDVVLDGVEMLGDPAASLHAAHLQPRAVRQPDAQLLRHPVPVVAGQLQTTGRSSAARVMDASFADARDRFELDLAAAYRVPGLASLVRTFTHDRTARAVSICDEARFTTPTDVQRAESSPIATSCARTTPRSTSMTNSARGGEDRRRRRGLAADGRAARESRQALAAPPGRDVRRARHHRPRAGHRHPLTGF